MGKRYTKFNSNYLMRSQHQRTDLGTLLERDWVTTNGLNVLRFGSGRKIWYNSGNFVFTTANVPTYHKKHKLSTETKEWTWNDCESADNTVNTVMPSFSTTDLRDYAYYGSCVELIRATVEEIISDFPGRITTSSEKPIVNDIEIDGVYLNNPFNIDLHHKRVSLDKYDNAMRYMSHSWDKYKVIISVDGVVEEEGNVVKFVINDYKEDECKKNNEGKRLKDIIFTLKNGKTVTVYGYYINGSISYVYKPSTEGETIIIQPQQEYIDEYFSGLTGFKKQILRQDTKPLYTNLFVTPTEFEFVWYYPLKSYTWPSDDYCIIIDSMSFTMFISKLYDAAQNFDDMWSDNLYRSMTHESIKNFDWTYSREYYEGDEQDNIDGGERMQKIIRVFGRVFDDVKIYIDTIKQVINTSYDTYKNGPEALLSDHNELSGFDVKSTIGSSYDLDTNINSDFLKNIEKNEYRIKKDVTDDNASKLPTWYPTRKSTDLYSDIADNEFMRRLLLSSTRIMQSKGTQESIEMIFGLFGFGRDVDYEITEEAYYTETFIRSDECIDGTIDGKKVGEDWSDVTDVDWKEVDSKKKGDLAIEINAIKDLEQLYYDDTLSGVAMREIYLGRENTPYIVPYYDNTQLYDDNLIFQGKGGWGKMIKNNDDDHLDDSLDYQETLSYLHVVGTVGDLLTINPNTVEDNDVYYVVNLNDYTDYDENPPMDTDNNVTMSHYFILIDSANPHELYSWKNIVVKTSLDEDGNLQKVTEDGFVSVFGESIIDWKFDTDDTTTTDTQKLGTYKYAFKKMQYLDSIFSTNVGNNPHVGYGQYDDGMKYLEYMKLPFKYLIDKPSLMYQNNSLYELAKKFEFPLQDKVINDKIQIMDSRNKDGDNSDYVTYSISDDGETIEQNPAKKYDNVEKRWYINTKVLTIENKVIDGSKEQYYINYFKSVIMPYVMQVIPSTTILKLKGFS